MYMRSRNPEVHTISLKKTKQLQQYSFLQMQPSTFTRRQLHFAVGFFSVQKKWHICVIFFSVKNTHSASCDTIGHKLSCGTVIRESKLLNDLHIRLR